MEFSAVIGSIHPTTGRDALRRGGGRCPTSTSDCQCPTAHSTTRLPTDRPLFLRLFCLVFLFCSVLSVRYNAAAGKPFAQRCTAAVVPLSSAAHSFALSLSLSLECPLANAVLPLSLPQRREGADRLFPESRSDGRRYTPLSLRG